MNFCNSIGLWLQADSYKFPHLHKAPNVTCYFIGHTLRLQISFMIKFLFKYDTEPIATVDNISRFSNKDVWNKFEEAVTQQTKSTLINEFSDIRQKMEDENVIIECNFNPATQDFDYSYLASHELADLIEHRLK